jgi:hypothetical protein
MFGKMLREKPWQKFVNQHKNRKRNKPETGKYAPFMRMMPVLQSVRLLMIYTQGNKQGSGC